MNINKKQEIVKLLEELEDFIPTIPENLVEMYLMKCGVSCTDPKLKKFVALVLQKHISEITKDALDYNLLINGPSAETKRVTLSAEDICNALIERGVKIKKPPYFI
eukprot:GHVP01034469.1.p1 GENE.GHVP01034469.1~~GHVP01034469.1.p1  ORF type:complete len:106 (+),score=15.76 GHVP01034469.1:141-458(+)